MRERLDAFVDELRAVGLPVSLTDKLDALRALSLVPLDDRDQVEMALQSTLVKRSEHIGAFKAVFAIFFARVSDAVARQLDEPNAPTESNEPGLLQSLDDAELRSIMADALAAGDRFLLRLLAGEAVARFGGFEPGRLVAGTYYVMRTMRSLQLSVAERAHEDQVAEALARGEIDSLGARLRNDQFVDEIDYLRLEVDAEVRRLVASDRGAVELARSARRQILSERDLRLTSGTEIAELRRALAPLARVLASRLRRRRLHGRRGSLDFRRTMRRSMAFGGVPADLRFHPPKPAKPELVVFADISGSVASFARFTIELLYALHDQFSKVRCFAFIDGVVELTEILEQSADLDELSARINDASEATWSDGHSDYGHAFRYFAERWPDAITHRSTFIVMGDARNNYRLNEKVLFQRMAGRARHVFWLNPEPRVSWDQGDSIVAEYEPFCDEVRECRTLDQLRSFVDELV